MPTTLAREMYRFWKMEYEHNAKDYEKSKLENIIFILNKLIKEGKSKAMEFQMKHLGV